MIASYRKAIALDPDLLIAHRSLCVALMARGKLIEAEKPLRECLRLTPDPPMQSDLELTLTLDRKLLGVLQKHGVGHPSVSELVQPILLKVPFLPVRQDLVRKFWEGHPAEVLRELEQRTLTVPRMLFLETRKRVKHLPVAEQVPLVRHDDLGLVALDPSSWQIW